MLNITEKTNNEVATISLSTKARGGAPHRRVMARTGPMKIARLAKVWAIFSAMFLPEGYPMSVSSDYTEYQMYDTLQALCSSVTGTLSTTAVLKGVGVGNAEATAASATMRWLIRDGTGMIGRVMFATLCGSDFDNNAKTWRLVADITNDLAIMLEIMSALFPPEWFLLTVCVASVLYAVTGVAGGATRASLTQHFAVRGNTADVSAKDGSQETAVGFIGMFLGMFVTWTLHDSFLGTWLVFLFFTALHLFANYRGVRCVVLPTLNRQRAEILFAHFDEKGTTTPMLTATEVSRRECVIPLYRSATSTQCRLGCGVMDIPGLTSVESFQDLIREHPKGTSFLCGPTGKVLLCEKATTRDMIAAYYVCYKLFEGREVRGGKSLFQGCPSILVKFASAQVPKLLQALGEAGWVLDRCQLAVLDKRCDWPPLSDSLLS